jgi:hypothetical protein
MSVFGDLIKMEVFFQELVWVLIAVTMVCLSVLAGSAVYATITQYPSVVGRLLQYVIIAYASWIALGISGVFYWIKLK